MKLQFGQNLETSHPPKKYTNRGKKNNISWRKAQVQSLRTLPCSGYIMLLLLLIHALLPLRQVRMNIDT